MQYTITYKSIRQPGQDITETFEFDAPPQGFALGRGDLLDWVDLPQDIRERSGHSRLTQGARDTVLSGESLKAAKQIEVVRFAETVGGQRILVRLDGRPELQAAVAWLAGYHQARNAARQAHWHKEREARIAAQMAEVPAGYVYLQFVTSKEDGWVEIYRDPAGRELRNPKITGGDRAKGWGDWAYATPENVEAAAGRQLLHIVDKDRLKQEAAARREASRQALLSVTVPAEAVAAYREHQGSAERAWEREDETGYALVHRYADAIEAQGLAREVIPPLPPIDDPSEIER